VNHSPQLGRFTFVFGAPEGYALNQQILNKTLPNRKKYDHLPKRLS
jgi:hypothetical protein